jgi:hypothetical protein
MADPTTPPGTRQGKLSPTARTRPESPFLEQPNFGYRLEAPHQTYFSPANANPFAALEKFNPEEEDLKHTQEEMGDRWLFPAGRKLAPKFVSPGKAPPPPPPQPAPQRKTAHRGVDGREHAQMYTALSLPL